MTLREYEDDLVSRGYIRPFEAVFFPWAGNKKRIEKMNTETEPKEGEPFIGVGDIIRIENPSPFCSGFRVWRVNALHFGDKTEESVIELFSLDKSMAKANGKTMATTFVPYDLILLGIKEKLITIFRVGVTYFAD